MITSALPPACRSLMKSLLLSCIIAAQVFFILLVVAACYATIFVYAEPVMMKIVIVWIFSIGAIVLLHLWAKKLGIQRIKHRWIIICAGLLFGCLVFTFSLSIAMHMVVP